MIEELYKGIVNAVLPLVYDDSLSYYEVLCKTTDKVNEVIDEFNKLEEKIKDVVNVQEVIDGIHKGVASVKCTGGIASGNVAKGELFWNDSELREAVAAIATGEAITSANSKVVTIQEWVQEFRGEFEKAVTGAVEVANAAKSAADSAKAAADAATLNVQGLTENVSKVASDVRDTKQSVLDEISERKTLVDKDSSTNRTVLKGSVQFENVDVVGGTDFNSYASVYDSTGAEVKVMVGTEMTDEMAKKIGTGGGGSTKKTILCIGDKYGVNSSELSWVTQLANFVPSGYSILNKSLNGLGFTASEKSNMLTHVTSVFEGLTTEEKSGIGSVVLQWGECESAAITAAVFDAVVDYIAGEVPDAKIVACPFANATAANNYSRPETFESVLYYKGVCGTLVPYYLSFMTSIATSSGVQSAAYEMIAGYVSKALFNTEYEYVAKQDTKMYSSYNAQDTSSFSFLIHGNSIRVSQSPNSSTDLKSGRTYSAGNIKLLSFVSYGVFNTYPNLMGELIVPVHVQFKDADKTTLATTYGGWFNSSGLYVYLPAEVTGVRYLYITLAIDFKPSDVLVYSQ